MDALLADTHLLYESGSVQVWRAKRRSDGLAVIAKMAQTPRAAQRLRYEWHMLQRVAVKAQGCVAEPVALTEIDANLTMLCHDGGGMSLSQLYPSASPTLRDAVHMGMQIAQALEPIHQARVAHKHITPDNIVCNVVTGSLQVIDFGIASYLPREVTPTQNVRILEGTPAYWSPEQTGRTHGSTNYRTDLYALGVTLYRLFTGRLPFEQKDSSELVSAILTATPAAVHLLQADVPIVLSAIVERLLQKDPDRRYQSAHGVAADLRACLACLDRGERDIPAFALGAQDRIERPIVPFKLYGRDQNLGQLVDAFHRTQESGRACLVTLRGPPGIGKSSLMAALQPTIMREHGIYIAGKHDALRQHVPFSAFTQAVSIFVRHVLVEPAEVREAWVRRLRGVLGNIGQALVDIAPDLESLLGKQHPVPALGPRETENRLLTLTHRFVVSISTKQPLVLFLDDLQWADSATLRLLHLLATSPQQEGRLLLVAAYRDNEAHAISPLRLTLEDIAEHAPLQETHVEGLKPDDVERLIADILPTSIASTAPLAHFIWQKTLGNPFFIHEMMRHLWDHELVCYVGNHFTFDMQRIAATPIAPTMVEMLTERVRSLPGDVLETLIWAACVGDAFALRTLCKIQACQPEAAAACLDMPLQAGLIVPLDRNYRYATSGLSDARYRFAHDKIRQAVYEMLPQARASHHHLKIARTLHEADANDTFAILEHYAEALPLITDADERAAVAALALRGAMDAKRSTAYSVVRQLLGMAKALFPEELRETDFSTYRMIAMETAQGEFLDGNPELGLQHLNDFLPECQSKHEMAQVHALRATIFDNLGHSTKALEACSEGLQAVGFGFDFKKSYNIARLLAEIMIRSRKDRPRQLLAAPDCKDANAQVAMTLLGAIAATAYYTSPVVYRNVCLYLATLSIRHGSTRESAFAYAVLTAMLCTLNRYELAREYAAVARGLLLRRDCARPAGALFILVGWSGYLENSPLEQATMARRAMTEGLESSDVFTRFAINLAVSCAMASSLPRGEAEAESLRPVYQHLFFRPLDLIAMRQYARCLQGKTHSPFVLHDGEFGEEGFIKFQKDGTAGEMLVLMSRQMFARQLHGDTEGAYLFFKKIVAMDVFVVGTEATSVAFSFYGLALLTEMARKKGARQTDHAKTRRQMLKKLRRLAEAAPSQWLGVHLMACAEMASLDPSRRFEAAQMYDRACVALESSQWKERRALAHDRAGHFYMSVGMVPSGRAHLQRACDIYADWGALLKTEMLRREVREGNASGPHAAMAQLEASRASGASSKTIKSEVLVGHIDVSSLLQVFQSIASELVMETLTQKVAHAAQQVAGASRCVLLIGEQESLRPMVDTAGTPEALPRDVIRFVARSRKSLVMHDLVNPEVNDTYLGTTSAQAVVCLPLMYQGSTKGVLYAENSVSSQAFPPEHVVVLQIIATQTSIAMQNVRLYNNLEAEVARRTVELRATHAKLIQMERETTEAQMAGGFAHEMRNALSAARMALEAAYPTPNAPAGSTVYEALAKDVQTMADLAASGGVDDASRDVLRGQVTMVRDGYQLLGEMIEPVKAGVERGLAITRDALAYASVGQVVAGDDAVSAKAVAQTVVNELEAALRRLHIVSDIQVDGGIQLPMKEEHAYAILRNLLANAADAFKQTPSTERIIRIKSTPTQSGVVIVVEDTGCGMSALTQREVFKPFFTTKGAEGTGLGLGLSRKLARAYGGDLTFESHAGAGTRFFLTLPRHGAIRPSST